MHDNIRLFLQNAFALTGLIICSVVVALAVLGPVLTPYTFDEMDLSSPLAGPSKEHWLGTDEFGRDLLTRISYGARVSLRVGLIGVVASTAIGAVFGLYSGYLGGYVDQITMRIMEVLMAFPNIVLALLLVGVLGSTLTNVIIAVSVSYIPFFARITRAETLAVRGREFIVAAKAIGCGEVRIMTRHILPNIVPLLIVQATINLAYMMLVEAALSYMGLGTQPPTPSWGRMLTDARPYLYEAPYLSIFPGMAVFVAVIGFSMLGDGLRDVLDPRLR